MVSLHSIASSDLRVTVFFVQDTARARRTSCRINDSTTSRNPLLTSFPGAGHPKYFAHTRASLSLAVCGSHH